LKLKKWRKEGTIELAGKGCAKSCQTANKSVSA